MLPPRKSLRLQRKEADVFIPPPESKVTQPDITYQVCTLSFLFWLTLVILLGFKSSPVKCPPGPLPMEAINMEEGSKLPSELVELWSEVELTFHVLVTVHHSSGA